MPPLVETTPPVPTMITTRATRKVKGKEEPNSEKFKYRGVRQWSYRKWCLRFMILKREVEGGLEGSPRRKIQPELMTM